MQVEEIKTDRLRPWRGRPKQSRNTCDALMESIRRFGFLVPVLCDGSYRIISGHMRVLAAKRLGMKSVPVIVLHLSGWEKRAFTIAESELSRKQSWKQDSIRKNLVQLSARGFDPSTLGFDRVTVDALLEKQKTIKWRSVDRQITKKQLQSTSLLSIRVPAAAKEAVTSKARKHAERKGIRRAGSPDLLGAVVMDLLKGRP